MTQPTGWSLAVDFGTSNTAAAYQVGNGRPQPVRLSEQADQMPSSVLASDTGIVVGSAAVRAARLEPERFENCPKRRLGEGEILLGSTEFAVVDLVAAVLHQVLVRAMRVAGGGLPSEVVLTYPQHWAAGRQNLLQAAAGRAGFAPGSVRLVSEPIAAASWYATTQPVPAGKYVAVFDFGGGTLDVALLRSDPAGGAGFTVVAADGIDPLGGETMDLRLQEWLVGRLREQHKDLLAALTAPEHLGALQTLREQIRHAKHELSEYDSARIPVVVGDDQAVVTVTSDEFDRMVSADIDSAIGLTRRILSQAGVTADQLHALYLTGGSSHLRLVHRRVTELLDRPPATLNDPKQVVALGALTVPRVGGRPVPSTGTPAAAPFVPTAQGPTHPTGPAVTPGQFGPEPTRQLPAPPFARPSVGGPPAGPRAFAAVPANGNGPAASGPGVTGARKNRVLLAIGAAVLVAAVAVGAWVVFRPRDSDPVVQPVTGSTQLVTTPGTSGPVSSELGTTPEPTTPEPTTPEPTTPEPTTPEPTTPEPTTSTVFLCWNNDTVSDTSGCPEITGSSGLQWIFPPADIKDRPTCEPTESELVSGEIELYVCRYDDLSQVSLYLTRWESAAAAKKYLDANMGAGQQRSADGTSDGKRMDGIQYGPATQDDGTPFFAFAYNSLPYSVEIISQLPGTDSSLDAKDSQKQLDAALDRQIIGFADLVAQGANPG